MTSKRHLQFPCINSLNDVFRANCLPYIPTTITFIESAVTFNYYGETPVTDMRTMLKQSKYIIYRCLEREDVFDVVMCWKGNNGTILQPTGVQFADRPQLIESKVSSFDTSGDHIIGTTMDVILKGIHQSNPIKAKVDTGASSCSLDAQDVNVIGDPHDHDAEIVTFMFRNSKYKTRVAGHQSVKSADGGVNNRPTVQLTVEFHNKTYPNIEFNLNDRTGMEYDVLLGMNFLSVDTFMIDPQMEQVMVRTDPLLDFTKYDQIFEQILPPKIHVDSQLLQQVYESLLKEKGLIDNEE